MTLECGRIAGVPVRLHWSALIVATYLAYSLGTTTSVVAALVGVIGFAQYLVRGWSRPRCPTFWGCNHLH